MGVVIRPAGRDEIDSAVAVWQAANPASAIPHHVERLRTWARGSDTLLMIAEDEKELIGMALAMPGRANDGAGRVILGLSHLTGICVLPERQGQHLGGQLLDAVLAEIRGRGYDRATLWARSDNGSALRLFEARGFRRSGRVGEDDSGASMVHLVCSLHGRPEANTQSE